MTVLVDAASWHRKFGSNYPAMSAARHQGQGAAPRAVEERLATSGEDEHVCRVADDQGRLVAAW